MLSKEYLTFPMKIESFLNLVNINNNYVNVFSSFNEVLMFLVFFYKPIESYKNTTSLTAYSARF